MTQKITAQLVKELRDRSGVGMAKCKDALVEADGDIEKAADILRKKGLAASVKKEGRETKEGLIGFFETEKAIALLEVNTETDFVAKNEKVKKFVGELAEQLANTKLAITLDTFLKTNYSIDPSITIDEYRNLLIQAIGENIKISRIALIHKKDNSSYGIYSHMNGKIVTIVEIKNSEKESKLAYDIAMHVAAENPQYLKEEAIPENIKRKEEEIFRSQLALESKPEFVIEKIIKGKIKAFVDQVCLLNQKYIKDPSITVETLLKNRSKESNAELSISCFWRWQLGESLE